MHDFWQEYNPKFQFLKIVFAGVLISALMFFFIKLRFYLTNANPSNSIISSTFLAFISLPKTIILIVKILY